MSEWTLEGIPDGTFDACAGTLKKLYDPSFSWSITDPILQDHA
jgi:hypothetical protein